MNNIAQSNPEGELERLGGVRRSHEPDEEGLNSEGQGGTAGGVSGGDAKKKTTKKHKKWPMVVGILVVLAAAGGGVTWWMLEGKSEENGGNVAVEDESAEVEDEGVEIEVRELDIKNELVQRVYGEFGAINSVLRDSFYINRRVMDGELTTEDVKLLVLESGMWRSETCGFEEIKSKDVPKEIMKMAGSASEDWEKWSCIAGTEDAIKKKALAMFGKEIDLVDNEAVNFRNMAIPEYYDAETDAFYAVRGGTDINGSIVNYLVKAEMNGDEMYLYEVALAMEGKFDYYQIGVPVYSKAIVGSEGLSAKSGDKPVFRMNPAEYNAEMEIERPSWTKIAQDKLDYYRWTFKKLENGDYIYQSVEKIK